MGGGTGQGKPACGDVAHEHKFYPCPKTPGFKERRVAAAAMRLIEQSCGCL